MALLLHNGWHTPHSPGAGGVLIKLGHMKPFPPLLVLLGSTISSHPSRFIKALPLYRRWYKGYCERKRFPWKKEKKKLKPLSAFQIFGLGKCVVLLWYQDNRTVYEGTGEAIQHSHPWLRWLCSTSCLFPVLSCYKQWWAWAQVLQAPTQDTLPHCRLWMAACLSNKLII